MVSGTFHSPFGVLFIIQSPYWFTIGRQGVFSLGGWTLQLHTEFHELRATLVRLGSLRSLLQAGGLWDRSEVGVIKLLRARGGCLGVKRR